MVPELLQSFIYLEFKEIKMAAKKKNIKRRTTATKSLGVRIIKWEIAEVDLKKGTMKLITELQGHPDSVKKVLEMFSKSSK